jgi:hypothetical protein
MAHLAEKASAAEHASRRSDAPRPSFGRCLAWQVRRRVYRTPLSDETEQLRKAAADLDEQQSELANVAPRADLRVLHTQLLAAVAALQDEANHNADVLDEAVEPAEGESVGRLNSGKLRTMREETALPDVRQMNRAAMKVVTVLQLDRTDYDVPGGRDVDSDDHSDEL